jgi:low affinity Fe/Cu permease
MASDVNGISKVFGGFASRVAWLAGRPSAFVVAILAIVLWLFTGPLFQYSELGSSL